MGRRLLAIEPVRAAEIDFTAPYVLIEGTYMVPRIALKEVDDVDRPGIRIAVGSVGLRSLSDAHAQARAAGARQGRRRQGDDPDVL